MRDARIGIGFSLIVFLKQPPRNATTSNEENNSNHKICPRSDCVNPIMIGCTTASLRDRKQASKKTCDEGCNTLDAHPQSKQLDQNSSKL